MEYPLPIDLGTLFVQQLHCWTRYYLVLVVWMQNNGKSGRSGFWFEQIIQMQRLEQASAHIGRDFRFLSAGLVQVNCLGHGIEHHPTVFATGHVALELRAKVIAQLAIDIIGEVSE